ncbi:MAG: winged helix DNA-binding protein [Pseudohongiellaceae bacterium]
MSKTSVSTAESLLAAARRFTRASLTGSKILFESDLSRSEWHLLWLLKHWPDEKTAQPSALAQRLRVTAGSVAQQLRHLEEMGQVQRLPDKLDRRVVLVRLTAKGTKKLRQVQAEFIQQYSQLTKHLGPAETKQLIHLLLDAAEFLEQKESAGKC